MRSNNKGANIVTTTNNMTTFRRRRCLAVTILMFKICCKAEPLVANAAAEDVRQESSDSDDKTHNIETATATVTINEIGEEEISRSIPPSIAEATLVGARLRHYQHNQHQGDEQQDDNVGNTYPSHRHNNNKKHIDIDLLDWDELPDTMKDAALTLGCNSQMWDSGEESAQCELFWSDLTDEEQKAAMVLGYQSTSWDEDDDNAKDDIHDENENQNTNPNNVAGQCHWGKMGCNKGALSWNANSASSKINATPGHIGNDDGNNDDDSVTTHQSSLAGSATAKIEAHVMKGAGQSKLSSKKDLFEAKGGGIDMNSNKPPNGFSLAARIVTSPHDGLSYFLDVPEADIATMMTIPYTFLECGQNIESTTDAFTLEDMVVRHLPAGDIAHWVNLGGGVTIDTDNETDFEGPPRYINGNHDGRAKLLVALTPIEIIVSGNEEESRIFQPGDIVLMEDTLGKGHKMRARGKDLSVLMISLPQTVHYPMVTAGASSSLAEEENTNTVSSSNSHVDDVHQSLFGFARKHRHPRSKARHSTKPCPLEYDSAYSSLFTPTSHTKLLRQRRKRRRQFDRMHLKNNMFTTSSDSTDDPNYPPPPGYSTYKDDDKLSIFKYLPSLRRSMLFGIGLSLTSSFVYCAQLLYPPFLALWGGATVVILGAVVNVVGVRWLYQQNWLVMWEEERRWKRELKLHKKKREAEKAAEANESNVNEQNEQ